MRKARKERFFDKVNKTETCWFWTGSITNRGYGKFAWSHRQTVNAHRASYRLLVEEIPDGKLILHKCDNPLCVNPEHLWAGTQSENIQDCVHKGRHPRKGPPIGRMKGEGGTNSVLKNKEVLEIRRKYIPRIITMIKLGEEFGVSAGTIKRIIARQTWTHI